MEAVWLALETEGLAVEGRAEFDAAGRLVSADLARLRLGEALDTRLVVTRQDGRTAYALRGGTVDLLALDRLLGRAPGPAEPRRYPRIEIALDRLVLTSRLALAPATGRIGDAGPGEPFLAVEGPANGGALTRLALTDAGRGLTLRLTTEDAGRLLGDAAYFRGGIGGSLVLDVAISPDAPDMDGRLLIRDIVVKNSPVLGRLLSVASITGVLEELTTGGLAFSSVESRFRRRDGRLYLERSRALGGSIGLTIEGVYDETGDRLDLSGVFSPAYLLNGLLGEVPLLGSLLTGRRGEGVFGFAYTVRGSSKSPAVAVNPLSILAPGALRGVLEAMSSSDPAPDPAPRAPGTMPALPAPPAATAPAAAPAARTADK